MNELLGLLLCVLTVLSLFTIACAAFFALYGLPRVEALRNAPEVNEHDPAFAEGPPVGPIVSFDPVSYPYRIEDAVVLDDIAQRKARIARKQSAPALTPSTKPERATPIRTIADRKRIEHDHELKILN